MNGHFQAGDQHLQGPGFNTHYWKGKVHTHTAKDPGMWRAAGTPSPRPRCHPRPSPAQPERPRVLQQRLRNCRPPRPQRCRQPGWSRVCPQRLRSCGPPETSCSWHKFLRCMLTVFPFLEWICLYRFKDWLLGDLLAGLSVGLVQVPQGLILSLLTRQLIPPLNVTYAAFCSSVIYVIFGSCHQMSIGPFFLVSALMINVLKDRPFNNGHLILGTFVKDDFSVPTFYLSYNRSLSMVASTTFLTGIIQLSMGMLGMGFMATYLPEAATSAYLAAVALHIILAQMTCILGIMVSFHAGPISFIYILGFSLLTSKITMATENSKMLMNMIPYRI